LAAWQRANVTAFLTSGIAAQPGIVGEAYLDASGNSYLRCCASLYSCFRAQPQS
jgi:hypothetical protein